MENKVNFYPNIDDDPSDYINMQTFVETSIDDIVNDVLVARACYAGLIIGTSGTQITVGSGRLYSGGKVYSNPTSYTQDMINNLPLSGSTIAAVLVNALENDNTPTPRQFVINAETLQAEAQTVNMVHSRVANVSIILGLSSAQPANPVVPVGYVLVGYVLLTTSGLSTITQVPDNQVPNLDSVLTLDTAIEAQISTISSRVNTIVSDIAALQAQLDDIPNANIVQSLTQDVSKLKALANLPQTYVNYRQDDFQTAALTNASYTGTNSTTYNIQEGLRFGYIAENQASLVLLNAYDTNADVSTNGILLPSYTTEVYRIIEDQLDAISLTQFSSVVTTTQVSIMGSSYYAFGATFTEALDSAFFTGGSFNTGLTGIYSSFEKDGQVYQIEDTKTTDQYGVEIYRAQNYWLTSLTNNYWTAPSTPSQSNGYFWAQTFLQDQSRWVCGIEPRIATVPTNPLGTMTLGICETDANNEPDLTKILGQITLTNSQIVPSAGLNNSIQPLLPFYLETGTRYAYFIQTNVALTYRTAVGYDNAGGTLFYMIDGGIWNPMPTANFMFDLQYCVFNSNNISINLNPLTLNGGIGNIEILANTIVPDSTTCKFQVLVNSVWQDLAQSDTNFLATLNPLLQFRVTMTGTLQTMPGIQIGGSVVTTSRSNTVLKQGSVTETLATASSKISVKSTLVDFNPTHHTYTAKISAGGNLVSPSTSTDTVIDSRTIERLQVFNLGTAVTSYVTERDGTTDNPAILFTQASAFELAQ